MTAHPDPRRPSRDAAELRVGLVIGALMLAISGMARLATRLGWVEGDEFSQRALMVLLAGLIVLTGNNIPKYFDLRRPEAHAGRLPQAFFRFAGWTWVLAGLGLGLAWVVLPKLPAQTATLILMPLAILLIAVRWIVLRFQARGAGSCRAEAAQQPRE